MLFAPSAFTILPTVTNIRLPSTSWTIKARITSKSDIRRWSNAKGEGTLFSIDLLDNEGGEIRATFFKDSCEKFFPVLEEGKVIITCMPMTMCRSVIIFQQLKSVTHVLMFFSSFLCVGKNRCILSPAAH